VANEWKGKDLLTLVRVIRKDFPTESGDAQNFKGDVAELAANHIESLLTPVERKQLENQIISLREVQKFPRFRRGLLTMLFFWFQRGRASAQDEPVKPEQRLATMAALEILRDAPEEKIAELREALGQRQKKTKKKK
jgi:hypothetical protein